MRHPARLLSLFFYMIFRCRADMRAAAWLLLHCVCVAAVQHMTQPMLSRRGLYSVKHPGDVIRVSRIAMNNMLHMSETRFCVQCLSDSITDRHAILNWTCVHCRTDI